MTFKEQQVKWKKRRGIPTAKWRIFLIIIWNHMVAVSSPSPICRHVRNFPREIQIIHSKPGIMCPHFTQKQVVIGIS